MVREKKNPATPLTTPPALPATNCAAAPMLLVIFAMTSSSGGSPGALSRSHCQP